MSGVLGQLQQVLRCVSIHCAGLAETDASADQPERGRDPRRGQQDGGWNSNAPESA
jgi:hypothetical protein